MRDNNIIRGGLALIYRQTKNGLVFLIVKNKFSGNYSPPGGAAEPGESNIEALKRELKEEINYEFEDNQLSKTGVVNKFVFNNKNGGRDGRKGEYEFFIIKEVEKKIKINPEEVTDYYWLTFEEAYPLLPFDTLKDSFREVAKKLKK